MLDRWSITITNQSDTNENTSKGSKDNLNDDQNNRKMVSEKIPFNIINNYFSIGVVSLIKSGFEFLIESIGSSIPFYSSF